MEKPTMMPYRIFPDRNRSAQKICTGSPAYSDYKVRSLRGTTSASKEWTNGRLYPRCRGTTTLVPRASRGAKKLFSKNEILTRTHSRRADTEVVLKQRVAANGGEGITELVLSEKGFCEKGCFYRRKGSRWKR